MSPAVSGRAWGLYALMAVLWGIPYLFIKEAVDSISPAAIVAGRTLLGAAVLLPIALHRGALRRALRVWPWVLAFGAVEMAGPFLLLGHAEQTLPSGLTGLLVATVPLFAAGIARVLDQQFELGRQVLAAGLVPIIEPEVDIHSPEKAKAEDQLKAAILSELDKLGDDQHVMLKLTLPDVDNHYRELVEHPKVLRVVALSGGYKRPEACAELAKNKGIIASFSRALLEDLRHQMSDDEFNTSLGGAINEIHAASVA